MPRKGGHDMLKMAQSVGETCPVDAMGWTIPGHRYKERM